MDVRFLVTVLHFYSALNYLFPFRRNTVRKNLFLSVCHCLDPKISMREINILYPHGGLIGYGNSNLDTLLRFSKVFRLHASLHDAAGAVYAENGSGPGYCYVIGRGPSSCFFRSHHGTFLLVCIWRYLSPLFQTVWLLTTMTWTPDNSEGVFILLYTMQYL